MAKKGETSAYWAPEGYASVRKAADILKIPEPLLYRAVRSGLIPSYRIPSNKLIRFVKLDEVEAALAPRPIEHTTDAAETTAASKLGEEAAAVHKERERSMT